MKEPENKPDDFFNRHPVLFGFMAASLWISAVLNFILQLLNYLQLK
ncbi:MAG: hypothetical protein LIO87_02675 [Eubacterium sp.]|nr:hypothetical protein [Eubacterium sp.]